MSKSLRLGFFNHAHYFSDNSGTFTYSSASEFLRSLEGFGFSVKNICAPLCRNDFSQGTSLRGFKVESPVHFFPLPCWKDLEDQLRIIPLQWNKIKYTVRSFVTSSDALWVRAPTPLLGFILNEARRHKKPTVVHMAGNVRGLWRSSKHKGLKKILVRIGSELIHRRSRKVLENEILLATGPELCELFSGNRRIVVPFVDSLVSVPTGDSRISDDVMRLLFVGRVDHGKGLFVTLKALKRIKEGEGRVSLSIVGSGPILEELKKEARDLGVEDMIVWRGFVPYGDELDCEYQRSRVLLLPSESTEGFPRVILEAWANGVAVIASNIGGMGRIIHNNVDGILIPPSDEEALASAIQLLTDNKELRESAVRNAYRSLKPWTLRNQSLLASNALNEAYARVRKGT